MAEQGGHKVGRETRLGFGLVSWSFDYESAATISQRPRPPSSQLTIASATTTTYWSVLCRQATTQTQLPANLIVLVAEPRKLPGREEGDWARGSECKQRALAPASNEAWNFSALATVSSFFFFLLPLALLDISDTLVEGICVLSRKPKLYEVELTEVLLRNMPCKQYENLLQTL